MFNKLKKFNSYYNIKLLITNTKPMNINILVQNTNIKLINFIIKNISYN